MVEEERKLKAGRSGEGTGLQAHISPGAAYRAQRAARRGRTIGERKKEALLVPRPPASICSPNLRSFSKTLMLLKALTPAPLCPGFPRMALRSSLQPPALHSKSASPVPSPRTVPNQYFQPPGFQRHIIFIVSGIQLISPSQDFSLSPLPDIPIDPR